MSKKILKTPEDWIKELQIFVLDPDGWRKDNKDWNDPISRLDFERRAAGSTCIGWPNKYTPKKDKNTSKKVKRKKNKIKFSNKVALFKIEGGDDYRFVEIYDKDCGLEMPEFDIMMPLPARESLDQLEEFGGF